MRPPSAPARSRGLVARTGSLVVSLTLTLALASSGCSDGGGADPDADRAMSPFPATAAPSPSPAAPTPTPTSDPTAFDPDADLEQNLAVFGSVIDDVWAGDRRGEGRAYVDALVAAGFVKSTMELTADATTVGNAAESIQIAVLWQQQCLIGQVGPATGEPVAVAAPALAEGRCLVGDTRPIDW
nr:hypothetical protein [Microbacterium thalassium]